MFHKLFWFDAIERAVRTVAQSFLALVSAEGFNLLTADWKAMLSVGITAGLLSLLMSLSAVHKDNISASFVVATKKKRV
jgi:hypothetical protein